MAALAAVPSQARVLSRTGGLETSQPRKAVVKLDRARGVLKVYGTAQAIKDIRMCCSAGGKGKHDFQDPFRPQDVERQLECMTGPRKEISRASWAELMRTRTSKRQISQILLIDVSVSRSGFKISVGLLRFAGSHEVGSDAATTALSNAWSRVSMQGLDKRMGLPSSGFRTRAAVGCTSSVPKVKFDSLAPNPPLPRPTSSWTAPR